MRYESRLRRFSDAGSPCFQTLIWLFHARVASETRLVTF